MSVVIVTGIGTGVGKTATTAALATCAPGEVAAVKLVQTGLAPDDLGDAATIGRLARKDHVHEFDRFADALDPQHAAMLCGRTPLALADAVRRVVDLDAVHDLVLVEGTGGLLTPFDVDDRWTLVDLAYAVDAAFVLVTAPGPDMIADTALLVSALGEAQSLDVAGVVVAGWPAEPDLAARITIFDVQAMAPRRELAGVLPAGLAGVRTPGEFRRRARAALSPAWGGTLDTRAFVSRQRL